MIIRRVGPLSVAKISAMLYAIVGLIIGAFISLFAVVGGAAFAPRYGPSGMSAIFGVAAIVVCPIFYGALGFITSLIGAALYNVIASWVGGIELDVQQ
jgi:hypothetical protein